jgi:hypothetical protein
MSAKSPSKYASFGSCGVLGFWSDTSGQIFTGPPAPRPSPARRVGGIDLGVAQQALVVEAAQDRNGAAAQDTRRGLIGFGSVTRRC